MIIPALRSQYKEYGNNLRCLHGSITCIRLKFNTFGIHKRIVGGLKHYEMRMCVCVCFKDTLLRAQTLFSKTSGMYFLGSKPLLLFFFTNSSMTKNNQTQTFLKIPNSTQKQRRKATMDQNLYL